MPMCNEDMLKKAEKALELAQAAYSNLKRQQIIPGTEGSHQDRIISALKKVKTAQAAVERIKKCIAEENKMRRMG